MEALEGWEMKCGIKPIKSVLPNWSGFQSCLICWSCGQEMFSWCCHPSNNCFSFSLLQLGLFFKAVTWIPALLWSWKVFSWFKGSTWSCLKLKCVLMKSSLVTCSYKKELLILIIASSFSKNDDTDRDLSITNTNSGTFYLCCSSWMAADLLVSIATPSPLSKVKNSSHPISGRK